MLFVLSFMKRDLHRERGIDHALCRGWIGLGQRNPGALRIGGAGIQMVEEELVEEEMVKGLVEEDHVVAEARIAHSDN